METNEIKNYLIKEYKMQVYAFSKNGKDITLGRVDELEKILKHILPSSEYEKLTDEAAEIYNS